MAGQKKNDIGCFGALVYLVLLICGIVMLISVIGGILAVIAVAIVITFSVKLLYRLSKKVCIAIYKKYIKRKSYEELKLEIEETDSSLEYNETGQNIIFEESENFSGLDTGAAEAILNHVKVLADTINNTLDEKEFEQALIDIKSRLQLLSRYEKYNIFVGCTPSEDLRAINENEYLTRKKFRTRVYEARLSGLLPNKPQKNQKEKCLLTIWNGLQLCAMLGWRGRKK